MAGGGSCSHLLRNAQFCKSLPENVLERMEEHVQFMDRSDNANEVQGDYIYRSSDTDISHFYLILSGSVALVDDVDAQEYKHSTVNHLHPGDAFGEESILRWLPNEQFHPVSRQSTAIQVSSKLELLVIDDPQTLRDLSAMCLLQPRGFFFRPGQTVALLKENPDQRTEAGRRVLMQAIMQCGQQLPRKAGSELYHALCGFAASATYSKLHAGSIIFNYGDKADTVFMVLSGTAALFWNGNSEICLPAPRGVHHRRRGTTSKPVVSKPENMGIPASNFGIGSSLGCPQESVTNAVPAEETPRGRNDQRRLQKDVNHISPESCASVRRFSSMAMSECQFLLIPSSCWETLRVLGAVSVINQLNTLVQNTNRNEAANMLLAAYLKFFKSFAAMSIDSLLGLASKTQHRRYQEYDAIKNYIALNVRVSHLIIAGEVSTHAIRDVYADDADIERNQAILRETRSAGIIQPLSEIFGPVLYTTGPVEMLHKSLVGCVRKDNPVRSIAATIVDAALIPAEDISSLLENTSQNFYRMTRCHQILQIAPEERQQSEIDELVKMLIAVKIFEEFPHTCLQSLARVMTTRSFELGEIVFRQGDDANEVYIVLIGLMAMQVPPNQQNRKSVSPRRHRRSSISTDGTSLASRRASRSPDVSPMGRIAGAGGRRLSLSPVGDDAGDGVGSKTHATFLRAVRKMQDMSGTTETLKRSGDVIGDSIFSASGSKRTSDLVAKERSHLAVFSKEQLQEYRDLFVNSMVCNDSIRNVLELNPTSRSDDDLMMLVRFLKEAAIFRSQEDQFLVAIARFMSLSTVPRGSFLYKEGEPSDTFYLVLTGKLAKCGDEIPGDSKTGSSTVRTYDLQSFREIMEIVEPGNGIKDCFKRIAMNGSGPQYVFRADQHWSHSCLALERTEVLKVAKNEYDLCLASFEQNEHDNLKNYFLSVLPFKTWKPRDCVLLANSSQTVHADRGTLIFTPGQSADLLYFIQEGQCVLYKPIPANPRKQATQPWHSNPCIGLVGKGSLLGLDVCVSQDSHTRYVHAIGCRAETSCRMILLSRSDIDDIAGRNYCEQDLVKLYQQQVNRRLACTPSSHQQKSETRDFLSVNKTAKSTIQERQTSDGKDDLQDSCGKDPVRIAMNAAMMSTIEPSPSPVSEVSIRKAVLQLRSYFQSKYGPVVRGVETLALTHASEFCDAKLVHFLLKESGCRLSSEDFLKAIGKSELGVDFGEFKALLTSQSYLNNLLHPPTRISSKAQRSSRAHVEMDGYDIRNYTSSNDWNVRSKLDGDRSLITFSLSHHVEHNQSNSVSKPGEQSGRASSSQGRLLIPFGEGPAYTKSERNGRGLSNSPACMSENAAVKNSIAQSKSQVQRFGGPPSSQSRPKSAEYQRPGFSAEVVARPGRPKSAISIRKQSYSLMRELSCLPFMKQQRQGDVAEVETTQSQILNRYLEMQDVRGAPNQLVWPTSDEIFSLPEELIIRPSSASQTLLHTIPTRNQQGHEKTKRVDLGLFYARAKGVRPPVRNSAEVQKSLQPALQAPLKLSWVQILRQRNRSRLDQLKQNSQTM